MRISCDYLEGVVRIAAALDLPLGEVSDLTIEHDPWCLHLGGQGERQCMPRFVLNGEDVTHLARRDRPGKA